MIQTCFILKLYTHKLKMSDMIPFMMMIVSSQHVDLAIHYLSSSLRTHRFSNITTSRAHSPVNAHALCIHIPFLLLTLCEFFAIWWKNRVDYQNFWSKMRQFSSGEIFLMQFFFFQHILGSVCPLVRSRSPTPASPCSGPLSYHCCTWSSAGRVRWSVGGEQLLLELSHP